MDEKERAVADGDRSIDLRKKILSLEVRLFVFPTNPSLGYFGSMLLFLFLFLTPQLQVLTLELAGPVFVGDSLFVDVVKRYVCYQGRANDVQLHVCGPLQQRGVARHRSV